MCWLAVASIIRPPDQHARMRERPSIIVVGDFNLPEFAAPLLWLDRRFSLRRFANCEEALDFLATGQCAGQVIALGRPGRFSVSDVEALHAHAPMTPAVALVGALCDGETRSGKPWAGIPRIAWHGWQGAFEQLWGDRPQRRSLWLPRLASDLERLLAQPPLAKSASRSLLLIHSQDYTLAQSLVSIADQQGWRALHVHEHQIMSHDVADAWIWDLSPANDESAALALTRAAHPLARWILLKAFPRPEPTGILSPGRPAIIIGKPFSLPDLFLALAASSEASFATTRVA